jgi:poly(3-hydroxybutyrate) depolymerase
VTCDKDLMPMAGQDECSAPLKPNDDRLCMRMIGGQTREFYVYASPAFNPCEPATLIMDCHGLSESIQVHSGKEGFNLSGQMYPSGYGSGWRMAVQRDNAIVVTPAGIGQSWTVSSDVPFLNEVADFVGTTADINPDHVYVTGISMGGMMTVATGCDDAARWRGMAPVAMLQQSCAQLARPTPVISFHATGDALTSYSADRTLMQRIAEFNNCTMGPTASVSYGGASSSPDAVCYVAPNGVGDPDAPDPYAIPLQACPSSAPATQCETWSQCDEGVEVTFCTVAASTQPLGGHILYNNDTQLAIAEVAWPFFKKFWQ